jgi:alkanesulfonate monooxygenase SsuD/methylene tetrahydromethanopterin reductase-like flavin-dependent oxidoreductase (luciferase family)
MRLGVAISENLPIGVLRDLAADVEAAGLDSIWINDGGGRDPFLVCQAWAEATRKIDVGIGVASIWTRTPVQTAAMSATLQEISNGRFILGLGVSHAKKMASGHGVEVTRPVDAMRETLLILGQVNENRRTDVDGAVFSSHDFELEIDPRPPASRRYVAAMGPMMVDLAGTHADGVLLNWMTHESIASAAQRVRQASAEAGRPSDAVEVAGYVRLVVAQDRETARQALAVELMRFVERRAYLSNFERQGFDEAILEAFEMHQSKAPSKAIADSLGDDVLLQLGWYGSVDDDPTSTLRQYEAAGLQHLVARVLVHESGPVETAHSLISRLRLAVG